MLEIKYESLISPFPPRRGLSLFQVILLSPFILGFNPMRESTFRNEDLSPYPTDTPIKAVVLRPENKGSDPSFCEGRICCGELSDGDVVVDA
jgi:hypothetical protein